mmetsp:Transcript_22214/g.47781  ORF Transcript_22214/g.47781 Transcript_22214/m.47781 type:complete len:258 (+) Transcript_22214:61-834(+)|eukprot:CAMPEP_0172542734 /NCGR_PEP_ID=MMETSP1067-20121228/13285_1 /TAXON_ID=265564 ORGANISM="Thalassiosira punctigera, Strain Tpunct2005C2" /NCGR_SAMPLE_ID=MMETSP1067 /ASSEMBLY_ACC=CAM_ASM_000444 /LENGTH=257 /DNA_ID=CAMNT_0013329027 /DNA_START=187 /DNA_END=960 /DNA_ORIENTATION=+
MGSCCSCFDGIRGGKHGNASGNDGDASTEMTSRNSASGIPPPTHGLSRAMSAPTIQLQGFKVSGSGLALAKIPVEQDAAYWEWHVNMPGLPRPPPDDDEGDDDFQDVKMNGDDESDSADDPYALKFGVATRKSRAFYQSLERVEEEGDEASSRDDGTFLMRPIPDLRHGDVVGVAVQQSDLPMIQMLLNGEPLMECTINRFRGTVFPAVYIPPGAAGEGDRLEDEGISLILEFDEDNFKEMSPHARFGPLLAARGII